MPSEPVPSGNSRWHRFIAWLIRCFYFRHIHIVGTAASAQPYQLILCSHRNGAIDGYCVMAAFPQARFLISVQLLRIRLLRLLFCGIPVVRDKDRKRYRLDKQAFGNPIAAACQTLRDGEMLATFPEGSSEWGPHPLPYQPGTARIVRMLLTEGMPLQVVPLGLFYRMPDRFRSDVDVLLGQPVTLPAQGDDDKRAWEARIDQTLADALNAVSVNCPDQTTFERVERLAAADAARGEAYALAFKRHEASAALPEPPPRPAPRHGLRALCLIGMAILWPVLLVGWLVGKKADARNTVTFFRIVGGFAMALLWLPLMLVLAICFPWPVLALLLSALTGWYCYPSPD